MANKSLVSGKDRAVPTHKLDVPPEECPTPLSKPAKATDATKPKARASADAPGMENGRKFYQDFPVGHIGGSPQLIWIRPDQFLHQPNPDDPFRFTRANGEIIQPERFFTDGGSVPRAFWPVKDLSPWTYGPAFLLHDWEFDQHYTGKSQRSFEEARDILMEAIRTLMEKGPCEPNRLAFYLIYAGVDSFVARSMWDKPVRTLP